MRIDHSARLTRRTALLSAVCTVLVANAPPGRTPRVLFVCEKGTVKSPIAREILRSRAKERGMSVAVQSRALEPGDSAIEATKSALRHDGIDVSRQPLRKLSPADLAWADVVVAFNPLPEPGAAHTLRDWTDTPSVNASYPAAMASITERVDALLDELARHRKGFRR
ncbi:Low molecular weight phosphotyrosine protein phosphatase [Tsuneonella dongtanensis]|uniref:Low molecular weight phosphotyrosine protein phosphatase n=1 Tax=Tsuneonella dongtanensis TaxID=692370 RepID=A0A1B2AAA5_9SPHN|nr:hypothetical protein [Tsuneonella dongtanensis]ANY19097.1 Low molecular weight phosphotyrosine protein phosphatase [Tsuneonella dongtanensis]